MLLFQPDAHFLLSHMNTLKTTQPKQLIPKATTLLQ